MKKEIILTLNLYPETRLKESLERIRQNRLLCAEAIGKYVNKTYPGKIVVPIGFNCPEDAVAEEAFVVFRTHAPDVKLKNPVYLTKADGLLPPPDESPDADQLNAALLRCIELRADVIVCLTGLPVLQAEREKLILWKWGQNDPRLVFPTLPGTLFLKRSLFPCPIAAAIVPRTADDEEEECETEDPELLFESRYYLLTNENLDELAREKKIFLAPKKD